MHPRVVIALFGPTGVGKTAVAVALARRLRARGEAPVAVSADALQVYAGLETLTGAAGPAERAELEHRLLSFVPVTESFSAGRYARLAHVEIDGLLAAGRRPIVVGGTGLYLRAALTELSLLPPPRAGVRERWLAELARAAPRSCTRCSPAGRRGPPGRADRRPPDRARARAARAARARADAARGPSPSCGRRHAAPDAARRPGHGATGAVRPDRRAGAADGRGGPGEEVRRAAAAGPSATARQALGFQELLAGDVESMQRRTRNYARRQLTWMRKLSGVVVIDVTGRPPDAVAAEIERRLDEAER